VSVGVSVSIGPPALPDYPQPEYPGDNQLWMPGYWAYGSDDYYWVPGIWVAAPAVGLLWTPGYWGWRGGAYWWSAGYWGPHVGFYGGINYGHGYGGRGYTGGHWRGGGFYRDPPGRAEAGGSRVSFNGGAGGIAVRATADEETFARGRHTPATAEQRQHEHVAMSNPAQHFSANHGRPDLAATPRPGRPGGPGAARRNPTRAAHAPVAHMQAGHDRVMHDPVAQDQRPRDAGPDRARQAPRGQGNARQPGSNQPPRRPRGGGGHPPPSV
jgi:hypothetical protein